MTDTNDVTSKTTVRKVWRNKFADGTFGRDHPSEIDAVNALASQNPIRVVPITITITETEGHDHD